MLRDGCKFDLLHLAMLVGPVQLIGLAPKFCTRGLPSDTSLTAVRDVDTCMMFSFSPSDEQDHVATRRCNSTLDPCKPTRLLLLRTP